eukprot:4588360-Amphidinium_carterae.1
MMSFDTFRLESLRVLVTREVIHCPMLNFAKKKTMQMNIDSTMAVENTSEHLQGMLSEVGLFVFDNENSN